MGSSNQQQYRGGENVVRGQVREENFACQFGDENFPTKFFAQFGALPALCASSVAAVAR